MSQRNTSEVYKRACQIDDTAILLPFFGLLLDTNTVYSHTVIVRVPEGIQTSFFALMYDLESLRDPRHEFL